MDINDQELYQLIEENPRAVLRFYRQLMPVLERFFNGKIADSKDREEVIHDTFLSILDSLPQYKRQAQFSTWCIGIAKHELVDYYRRQKIKTIIFSKLPFLKDIVDKALGPQLALEEKETKHKIYLTLKNLSEGNAAILRLRYIEGLSVSAIAQKLSISYKAAESRLTRARLAFQLEFVRQTTSLQTDS